MTIPDKKLSWELASPTLGHKLYPRELLPPVAQCIITQLCKTNGVNMLACNMESESQEEFELETSSQSKPLESVNKENTS